MLSFFDGSAAIGGYCPRRRLAVGVTEFTAGVRLVQANFNGSAAIGGYSPDGGPPPAVEESTRTPRPMQAKTGFPSRDF